jgi:hypothetical protein
MNAHVSPICASVSHSFQSCGACGAKGDVSSVGEWDGQWPENYDANRPFPAHAVNGTDARFAENVVSAPRIATE